jgi:hypothetical protein
MGSDQWDLVLSVITLPSGYASLSQFQIMIWTFTVAASAVYVMALSGELIQVSTGTLVLLGISGAAGIGAKWHSQAQVAPDAAGAASGAAPGPTPAPLGSKSAFGDGGGAVSGPRQPMWSDLVFSEVVVNGVERREIDVARVQMLYFTAITASFVVLKVVTTYVIPEIPDGFQVLMGISNAVYMGSKVAQKST